MSALLEEEQSQLMILFQEQSSSFLGLIPKVLTALGFSCCCLERGELCLVEPGLLRGVVRELQGALNLTYSAVVARQEPLEIGHGGSQLGLAKE